MFHGSDRSHKFLCSPKNPGFHRCQNVGAGDEKGEVIVLDFK